MKALFLDVSLFLLAIIMFFYTRGVLHFVLLAFAILMYSLCVACVVILYYQTSAKNLLNRAGRRNLK